MKRVIQLIALSVICFIIFEQVSEDRAYSNIAGAVAKVTGSPFDVSGQTCSQTNCHSGGATPLTDIITSNIPASGYVPGTTYTVTVTASDPNKTRFGFEVTSQNSTGAFVGTINIIDTPRTHFSTFPTHHYLTHTLAGTDAPGHTAVWQFGWVAPSVGTGDVTFYGCVNYTNRDSTANGDAIHTTTLTVIENPNGISDPVIISSLNLYPNPVVDAIQLDYYLQKTEVVTIDLLDVLGKSVLSLFNSQQSSGSHHSAFPLNQKVAPGIYLVQMRAGEQTLAKKVIVL